MSKSIFHPGPTLTPSPSPKSVCSAYVQNVYALPIRLVSDVEWIRLLANDKPLHTTAPDRPRTKPKSLRK
jgi:hypothetical protein